LVRGPWLRPDDADATAGRGVAGNEGSPDLSAPGRRRHAPTLIGVDPKTVRRDRPPDNPEIREEMHKIAEKRRRFGYRRVGIMLERKGMIMNEKKLYRIYREEGLSVRRRRGRKRARGSRTPMPVPLRPNQRWSLDFLSDTFGAGRRFRILAVNDDSGTTRGREAAVRFCARCSYCRGHRPYPAAELLGCCPRTVE
jgi:transposase InsO family protein